LRVRRLAILAIVGQAVFPITWLVAGGLDQGYSHERQYVSELAGRHAEHPWIAALGIAALGLSWLALGDGDLSWRHYAHGFVGWANQLMLAATPFALAAAALPRAPDRA
jgi:hypothetical membrane protein